MLKVYFKPNCATCKTALGLLKQETDEEIELYEYLEEHPTQKDIRDLLKMLGLKAFDIVRTKEPIYKEKYEGKKLTNAEWIKALAQHPILIQRPIVIKDGKALIGRPPEKILDILK